jgi:hypothetical protein
LTPAKPAKNDDAFAGFPRSFWDDGDARWLLKVHDAAGEWYFNKELHQQILWWVQLPDLLELAAEKTLTKAAGRHTASVKTIEDRLQEAFEQAEDEGYRISKKKEVEVKPARREKGALAK